MGVIGKIWSEDNSGARNIKNQKKNNRKKYQKQKQIKQKNLTLGMP
jgi:hypothetical protein